MRHLEVVLHGDQRLGIAIKADMGDPRTRNHLQHAVQNACPGPQDRYQHGLLAVDQA